MYGGYGIHGDTFSRRNSRKKKRSGNTLTPAQDVFETKQPEKKRSGNKMAAPRLLFTRLEIVSHHFFLYQTNESCSPIVSRRLMLLRSLNKSYLRVTAPNAERPFYMNILALFCT